MNPLQYTSDEMVSSTELIRKSKKIFDKLQKKEVEKAIILRDGKPSFMLMEFSQYEEMMKEYLALKNSTSNKDKKKKKNKEIEIKEERIEETPLIDAEIQDEIDEEDYESALAEIENLDLEAIEKDEKENNKNKEEKEKEPLKDFWE